MAPIGIVIQVDIFRYFLSFATRLSNIIIMQTFLWVCVCGWVSYVRFWLQLLTLMIVYTKLFFIQIYIIILSHGTWNTQSTLIFHFSRCWLCSFPLFPSLKPLLFFDDRQKAVCSHHITAQHSTAQPSINTVKCLAVWQRN